MSKNGTGMTNIQNGIPQWNKSPMPAAHPMAAVHAPHMPNIILLCDQSDDQQQAATVVRISSPVTPR